MSSLPLVFDAPKRGLPPKHFADLDPEQRIAAAAELGLPKFRVNQLARQYYSRLNGDVAEMTDVPAAARQAVGDSLFPTLLTPIRQISCDDGSTRKTLWRLHDGTLLESVLMRYTDRNTLCISSQAGCGMACPFCATGQGGLDRNLSTAEIVDQVRAADRTLREGEFGEPLRKWHHRRDRQTLGAGQLDDHPVWIFQPQNRLAELAGGPLDRDPR